MTLSKFRVVLRRIRRFPTLISKMKFVGSGLPLRKYSRTLTQVYFQLINQQTKLLMEQQQKINSLRQIIFGGQNQNLNQSEPDASSILRLQMAAQLQVNINDVIIT